MAARASVADIIRHSPNLTSTINTLHYDALLFCFTNNNSSESAASPGVAAGVQRTLTFARCKFKLYIIQFFVFITKS